MSLPDPEVLATLLDGELKGVSLDRHPPRSGVIDSRRVQPGDVFFALAGRQADGHAHVGEAMACLLYTSPSPRDQRGSRMPSSA